MSRQEHETDETLIARAVQCYHRIAQRASAEGVRVGEYLASEHTCHPKVRKSREQLLACLCELLKRHPPSPEPVPPTKLRCCMLSPDDTTPCPGTDVWRYQYIDAEDCSLKRSCDADGCLSVCAECVPVLIQHKLVDSWRHG